MSGRGYVNSRSNWSDQWATPQEFFDTLDAEFCFRLDAAALSWSAKCSKFFTPDDNGLEQPWEGLGPVWLNPPYSDIGAWLEKARYEAQWGSTVVVLVPCVPDRKWWADHVEGKAEVRHVAGRRLYFTSAQGEKQRRSPFPSCVLVYRGVRSSAPQTHKEP